MKLLHLSDLHIHSDAADNRAVAATLAYVSKEHPEHVLVITGDITDDGAEAQYEQARILLAPFEGRLYICPGNHDFGAKGRHYNLERARRFDEMLGKPFNQGGSFAGATHPVVNRVRGPGGGVLLIALDSNLETKHPFDLACGKIGKAQLAELDALLSHSREPGVPVILFLHHHPYEYHCPGMRLRDAHALGRVIFGRVDALLFGHRHKSRRWDVNDNLWDIPHILACDDSPGKPTAREIVVNGPTLTVNEAPIA